MAEIDGATYAVFAVALSEAAANDISIEYYTENGTAIAGTDYQATTGTLIFEAGETSKTVQVLVYGRAPGDTTEERAFSLRLRPNPDVILTSSFVTECRIQISHDGDGTPQISIVVATGPKGDRGLTGLSAYELAQTTGFVGTLTQWLESLTGENVELSTSATHITWRVAGTTAWTNLVPLADLRGSNGTNGLNGAEVQLQKTATAIQWKYTTADTWTDLVLLSELKGDAGEPGTNGTAATLTPRGAWVAATYNPGDYVEAESSADPLLQSLYFLRDTVAYVSATAPKDDATHWMELTTVQGPAGTNGTNGTNGVDGANGSVWHNGTADPASGVGANGDYYLNTTSGDVFKKIADAWELQGNIKGPEGTGGGGGSSNLTAVLNADLGVTAITLATLPGFTFNLLSNMIYKLSVVMPYRTNETTQGIAVGFGGTVGTQTIAINCRAMDSAGVMINKNVKARDTKVIFPTSQYTTGDNLLICEGVIFPVSAGTFTIQIAAAVQDQYCAAQKGTIAILEPIGNVT